MKRLFLSVVVLLCSIVVVAQPRASFIKVEVTPDHADWLYECGEKPQFDISVRTASNAPVEGDIYFEVSEDMLPPLAKGDITLKNGKATVKGYTMKKPGFLRCRAWIKVGGKTYEECAGSVRAPLAGFCHFFILLFSAGGCTCASAFFV